MSAPTAERLAAERGAGGRAPGRAGLGIDPLAAVVLVVGAAVVCALVAVGAATSVGAVGALGLGLAAIGAALLVRLPLRWWPSVLLLVTVAAPAGALPVPGFRGNNGSLSPTLLLVPLWLFAEVRSGRRRHGGDPGLRAVQVLGALLVAVLVVETVLSPGLLTSAGWAVNLAVMTALVPLVLSAGAARLLARTWIFAGGVLGVYATLEAFVLHANPLWEWVGGGGARASASLGNPLAAATFFAAATILGVVRWVEHPARGVGAALLGAAAGLAATGSRGALIATAAGLLMVLAAGAARRLPASRRAGAALVAVVVVFGAVVAVGLAQRTAAGQEEGSTVVRQRSLATGLVIAEGTGLLGQGPGRAYVVKTTTAGPGTDEGRSIENAWIELYVGTGAVGCAAFAAFVLGCLVVGVRRRSWDGVAVTTTLLVAYLFYNALEGSKPMTMLLLGAALGLCLVPSRSEHLGASVVEGSSPRAGRVTASSRSRTTSTGGVVQDGSRALGDRGWERSCP